MRLPKMPATNWSAGALTAAGFVFAAVVAFFAAWVSSDVIESVSRSAVERALLIEGEDWAEVETNGLQVILSGTAPTETKRFHAVTTASHVVDSGRVIDQMEVTPPIEIEAPHFSIEMLRNDAGVSVIGLIPLATDRDALTDRVLGAASAHEVKDFVETADYAVPEGWDDALELALTALELMPRSKISISAERVVVEAIADSTAQKAKWEKKLRRATPGGTRLALDISAPRPVITPFTLRFIIAEEGARFDACTVSTEAGRLAVQAAAQAAGLSGAANCTIGLGVPSPNWPDAVTRGISALEQIGLGALTFSDADVTLIADETTPQAVFDRVIGELEADLPEVFSLHAVLTPPARPNGEDQGPPEFIATLSPEGLLQLRGRIATEEARSIVESFARARFGVEDVYSAMRLDEDLPADWSVRTLAALEALSNLGNGSAIVQPNVVSIRGASGLENASDEVSRVLSEKLGEAQDLRINVRYEKKLDPKAALPKPEECVAMINDALAEEKITFAPGSADIELSSGRTVDHIADMLKKCPDVAMEIGGHTDSQGREEMNRTLSQRRAEAVLSALLARRVLTSNLTAHGYGEENPIADNDTEAGREANRRIEFRLIGADEADEGAVEAADEGGDAEAAPIPAIRPRARPENIPALPVEETAEEPETVQAEEPPVSEDTATTEPEATGENVEASATPEAVVADEVSQELPVEADAPAPESGSVAEETSPEADAPVEAIAPEAVPDVPEALAEETASGTAEAEGGESNTTTPDAARAPAAEEAGETAVEPEAEPGPPVVVHPELKGRRPRLRPAQDG